MVCNTLGLVSYNSLEPCWYCTCNTSDVPWTDFSWRARWRRRICDDSTFFGRVRKVGGFWDWPMGGRRTISLDTLHLIDHHGIGSAILGNLFCEVVRCQGNVSSVHVYLQSHGPNSPEDFARGRRAHCCSLPSGVMNSTAAETKHKVWLF